MYVLGADADARNDWTRGGGGGNGRGRGGVAFAASIMVGGAFGVTVAILGRRSAVAI
jgi:hypothetical protein